MQDLLRMIEAATPFALKFMTIFGSAAWIGLSLIRRRFAPLPLVLVSALYVGFLLHGTVVSRLDGWSDLLRWQLPDFRTIWWNFELGARTQMTAIHAVFNVALFVPWGFLGMCWQKNCWMGFLVLLSGFLMSVAIEFFQITHGLVFDLGDVVTNTVGTAAGCIAGLPVTLINGWIYKRKKRRKAQRGNP